MMDNKPTADEMAKMIDTAIARAEAADDDLRELRENTLLTLGLNPVDVTDGMEDVTIAYLLGGWKERIAELEAQLAATWRPVTARGGSDSRRNQRRQNSGMAARMDNDG